MYSNTDKFLLHSKYHGLIYKRSSVPVCVNLIREIIGFIDLCTSILATIFFDDLHGHIRIDFFSNEMIFENITLNGLKSFDKRMDTVNEC